MQVPVYYGMSDIDSAADELKNHGLLVVETTRTHAKQLYKDLCTRLDIDLGNEGSPSIIHASISVDDGGWTDFYVYWPTIEYRIGAIENVVRSAVRQAIAAGNPAKIMATVHYDFLPTEDE
ncbi:hypothetical protein [Chitiniphilus eburneus]|uniref:Uncharacterized protein n=1 Tax=Chitiniphilus eburneus TaxID=2571148 RepID=A0A4U0QHZ3_9NEIS|nr:hypothetical protein [Chitiniphilus eburneus]TJZ75574.1 hypothetical protein FAZ21_06565 [Chitiniphilus eburneus]